MQIVNRYMKRRSTSLIIREMPIKTTEISLHTIRMAIIKNKERKKERKNISIGEGVKKLELYTVLVGKQNGINTIKTV